ncbi:unnamed protein product [Timema podura]|uniref:Nudix hydrolase domain-containing protein n=1 Tax=Timema podura TaxID=61482 RepID=A0ABN7NX86_TIMPD|nr:unnamed protein product [Timema podura]
MNNYSIINNNNNNNQNTISMGSLTNCRFVQEEPISSGKWLSLARITYLDQNGVERKQSTAGYKCVQFTPFTLKGSRTLTDYSMTLSYKLHYGGTYKGLVEEQETPDVSALRELKECTGFTGSIKKIGPVLAMDPGASNCAMRLVTVEVNGDDYDNMNMTSFIDSQRFKEPILIPVSELLEKLSAFASAGFIIDSRIDAFAIGLVMGNNSRKNKIPTTLVM